jgi:RNA polymerase subunit RPABC4/transcription elongation factor Spt4
MNGILNWRKCKKCERFYDIGTNFEICPSCRDAELKKVEENVKKI